MIAIPSVQPLHSIHPGEWYFGVEYERLHTVLGSCVALTVWHPLLKIGGMCHYLLAYEPAAALGSTHCLDSTLRHSLLGNCRYAPCALAQLKTVMLAHAALAEYHVGVFGGGDMFAYRTPQSIGYENIAFARQWLLREKLTPIQTDVGGCISRSLMLDIATGAIQLKLYQMNPTELLK